MIKLIYGDCLNYDYADKIDCVITDPPYGIKYVSNGRIKSKKFDAIENDDNDMRFEIYKILYEKLPLNSIIASFCSFKNYAYDFIELGKYYNVKNAIIWNKGGGGLGDLKATLSTDYEICIIAHKGRKFINGKREGSVWTEKKVNPNIMLHPTEKPIRLIERICKKFSVEGDIIIDPFMGSGTTGIACVNTGRNFIGIEKNKEYYDIAVKRITEAGGTVTQQRL